MKPKLVMAWSSGKDSAMALQTIREEGAYDIVGLMTSVSAEYNRISHHGVRAELLEDQAAAIGLPLRKVILPGSTAACTNNVYEQIMEEVMLEYQAQGVTHVGFGDLYLEDLRAYRERNLSRIGMQGVFPLWMKDTRQLAREIIARGYRAILTCVEPKLGEPFAGNDFDESFLQRLPPGVDPCGENGEFHTFVYDGPIFRRAVKLNRGQIVCRDTRHYIDLLLENGTGSGNCQSNQIPPV